MDRVTAVQDRGTPQQGRSGAHLMRGDAHRQALAEESPAAARHAIDAVDDVTNILGTADGDLPEPVQERLGALVGEVERLRNEVELLHRHEAALRDQADHHPVLPVLHRRAFLRELNRLRVQCERTGVSGALVYLHLGGIEVLRDQYGIAASDAALIKAHEILSGQIEQGDAIGYLDGGDFAIALAVVTEAEATQRAQRMAERLVESPFIWNGTRHVFAVTWSRVPFAPGLEGEQLLLAADAARHARGPAG